MEIKFNLPDWPTVLEAAVNEFAQRVERRTPVQTGTARNGWEVTGSDENWELRNDVPYIGVLEMGSSQQAPAGMVRITMEEFDSILKEEVDKQFEAQHTQTTFL